MADTPRVLSLAERLLHYSGLWPRHRGKKCSLHSFVSYASTFLGMLVAASFFLSDQEVLPAARIDPASIVLASSSLALLLKRRALRQDTRRILLERKVLIACIAVVGGAFLVLQQLPCPASPAGAEDDHALFALEAAQLLVSLVRIAATDGSAASLMLATSYQFEVVAALTSSCTVGEPLPGLAAGSDAAPRTHAGATPASGKKQERTLAWKEIVALHQDALRNGNDLCELFRTIFLVYFMVTALDLSSFLFLIVEILNSAYSYYKMLNTLK